MRHNGYNILRDVMCLRFFTSLWKAVSLDSLGNLREIRRVAAERKKKKKKLPKGNMQTDKSLESQTLRKCSKFFYFSFLKSLEAGLARLITKKKKSF